MGFENIISYTKEPLKELSIISQKYDLDINLIDFKLLAFLTHYKTDNNEFQKLSDKELNIFENDELFLKESLQIEQEYKIQIYKKDQIKDELDKNIALSSNKNLTKIIAQINTKKISYNDNLAIQILQSIYKKMLKLNFLIGIRTFDFKKNLITLANKIKTHNANSIFQLEICKGIEPIYSQDESLIEIYKDKIKNLPQEAKVSGIIGVDENEIILRLNKTKKGKEGRDLKLRFLKVMEPKEKQINVNHSENIKANDNGDFIDYISLKKGYVGKIQDKYDIENIIDYQNVDFRQVGYIKAGLDKDVQINIKSSSELKDAVNSGVRIECEKLNIEGNVAQNTILEASYLNIKGNTHNKSKLYAKNACIKTHRGNLIAEYAQIELLESGFVKAKNVKIDKCLGGIIEAENVYIKELTNNNLITFFSNIVFDAEKGTNNKFLAKAKIDYEDPIKEFDELNIKKQKNEQAIIDCEKLINSSKKDIDIIKTKIEQLKENKQEIPQKYLQITNQFQEHLKELEILKQEEENLKSSIENMQNQILLAQEKLLNAKIINKSGVWNDLDEIKYEFIIPKQSAILSTKANENVKTFYVEKFEENNEIKIKIIKLDKYEEKDIEWLSQSKE